MVNLRKLNWVVYINIAEIPIAPSLCNNAVPPNSIMDAHGQKHKNN
jgi:hypothetical protein